MVLRFQGVCRWIRWQRVTAWIAPWLAAFALHAAGRLDWRATDGLVDAEINGWPLTKVLGIIAARTQWQIYVEPQLNFAVSAKFKGLKPGEALRRLLGNLNFALVPGDAGGSRLYVFRTSQQTATDRVAAVLEGLGTQPLADELIVTLKPGSRRTIEELARRWGAKIIGRIDDLRLYRLKFNDAESAAAARAELAAADDVMRVDLNYEQARPDNLSSAAARGVAPLNLQPRSTADGKRVVVGLIDTAVQTDGTVLKDFLLPTLSVAGEATPPTDSLTHGSGMAETILYGLSRASDSSSTPVRILPVDVYGDHPSTTTFEIAKGLYQAIEGGASIINLSLGGDTDSPIIRSLIEAGHRQGVIFIGAAGNEPVTTPTFPAAYPEVIAVTAITRNGEIAPYANRGDFIDVAASGSSIVPYRGEPYVVTGTSTATAYVSAVAAAMMSSTGKRGAELEAEIRARLALTARGLP